ncbi:uncharacterized protein G2W53_012767 [Senna tora]|uniref:Uncharacterized protein n=1 Tax=Senna tora TaxID=362788 RepID=A0A834WSM4_9FABA|nr:uncharacterized protein G2W53_012767 [Senna tora]
MDNFWKADKLALETKGDNKWLSELSKVAFLYCCGMRQLIVRFQQRETVNF